MKKNTIWTYTNIVVSYAPPTDRYTLILEKRVRLWDKLNEWVHIPFKRSDYGVNIWGTLWEWTMARGDRRSHIFARFDISKAEAEQISPGIGAKLDLRWPPSQSSDEL